MCLQNINIFMYKQDLALKNLQCLICHKTQLNQLKAMYSCGPPLMDVQVWDDQHESYIFIIIKDFRTIVALHLYCYFSNVSADMSADMSSDLLQVFVALGNLHGTSNYVRY